MNYSEDEPEEPEPPTRPRPPTSIEEKIAVRALAATYKDQALTKMIEDAARHQARLALRKQIRAFDTPDGPPNRPASAALSYSPLTATPAHHVPDTRPRTEEEKRAATSEFWRRAFQEEALTLDDLHPFRVRVFYRILRELTRLFDLLQPHELLEELPCPATGTPPYTQPRALNSVASRGQQVERLLDGNKVGLYPQDLPDPEQDARYVAAIGLVASYLGIEHGTQREPRLGRYGMRGLSDPELVRLALPAPQEIALWERVLVGDTVRAIVTRGVAGAEAWLQRAHGLDHVETSDLIKQAKAQAKRSLASDTEEERAIHILRLEDFARRAKKGLSLAGELGAYKQLSIAFGFGRIEPEDAVSEFVATVRRVNADERAQDALRLEDKE